MSFKFLGGPLPPLTLNTVDFSVWLGGPMQILAIPVLTTTYVDPQPDNDCGIIFGEIGQECPRSDFTGDSRFVSWWKFDVDGFLTDSLSSNDFYSAGSWQDLYDYREGWASVFCNGADYLYRNDDNLSPGFPLKAGDTTKKISFAFFFKLPSLAGAADYHPLLCKWNKDISQYSFWLGINNKRLKLLYYYVAGATTSYTYDLTGADLTAQVWYYVAVYIDGVGKSVKYYVFNADTRVLVATSTQSPANVLNVSSTNLYLGYDQTPRYAPSGTNFDSLIIANSEITIGEAVRMMRSTYPSAGPIYVDPTSGNNTTGDGSTWATAYKNYRVDAFFPGDNVYTAKSTETAVTGTFSITNGQVSGTTSVDMTGSLAQYDMIKIDNDPYPYLISSINATTIVLQMPYRGVTGSGKTLYKLTLHPNSGGNSEFAPIGNRSTYANPINYVGGVNKLTDQQDGFTIINSSLLNYMMGANLDYATISKMYTYLGAQHWGPVYKATVNYCGRFRQTATNNTHPFLCTFNNFVDILGSAATIGFYCKWYDCEIWDCGAGIYNAVITVGLNSLARRLRAGGVAAGRRIFGDAWTYPVYYFCNVVFEDCVFNEVVPYTYGPNLSYYPGVGNWYCPQDWIFRNCKWYGTYGADVLIQEESNWYGQSGGGQVSFEHHQQIEDDNQYFNPAQRHFDGQSRIWRPLKQINTGPTAPCLRISLDVINRIVPDVRKFFFKAEKGKTYRVGIWVMKNAAYGDTTAYTIQPFMRVCYFTGTSPNLVWTETDSSGIPHVHSIWHWLEQTITSGTDQMVEVQILSQSENTGAAVFLDDIGVEEIP